MILLRQFILRYIAKEKKKNTNTVLGVALGVAVVLAIQLANTASLQGFAIAVETLSGKAGLEITSNALGMNEERLADLSWIHGYGKVSPIIEGEGEYKAPTGEYES